MAEPSYLDPEYREQSMFDLIGTQSVTSDRPSYVEDPENILSEEKARTLQAFKDLVGTIGPTPYHQTEEFYQEAFDIAEGLAFPGAGIGASIRGGKAVTKGAFKSYWDDLLYGKNVTSAKGVSPKFDPLDRKLGISGNKKKFEYWQKQINRDSKKFSPEEMEHKYGKAYRNWRIQRKSFLDAMDNILGKEAKKLEGSGKLMKPEEGLISKILKRNEKSLSNIELEKARLEVEYVLKKYNIADPDIFQGALDLKGKPSFLPGSGHGAGTWGERPSFLERTGELPDIITQALRQSRN